MAGVRPADACNEHAQASPHSSVSRSTPHADRISQHPSRRRRDLNQTQERHTGRHRDGGNGGDGSYRGGAAKCFQPNVRTERLVKGADVKQAGSVVHKGIAAREL